MSVGDPRSTWTDADFESMSWHDAALHAIAIEPSPPYPGRVLLDLDYIVAWVPPEAPETRFTFQLAPATLVFDRASDLVTNLDLVGQSLEPALDAIIRSDPDAYGDRSWTVQGHQFAVKLRAPGFTQYLRRPPIQSPMQRLTVEERGGISFDERAHA